MLLLHHAPTAGAARCSVGGRNTTAAAAPRSRLAAAAPPPSSPPSAAARRRPTTPPLIAAAQQQQAPPASAANTPPAGASNPRGQMLVYVPPHPLIKHWLAVARNAASPPPLFRGALAELGRVLLYELSRDGGFLPTLTGAVDTSVGDESEVEFIDPTKPIVLVPIVRTGLPLLEHSGSVLPASTTHHLSFSPSSSSDGSLDVTLDTLPSQMTEEDRVVIADACLATGGTIMRAVKEVVARGASPWNVRVLCALAAPPALKQLADAYPGLCVYAACIDAEVDEATGLLRPGFGEAGARAFGGR